MAEQDFPVPRDGTYTMLVVDDDPIARALLKKVITSFGYPSPVCLETPAGIPGVMEKHAVDLVFLDLNMPGMSGRESLEMLTRTHPETPVVVITAEDSIETAVECMRLGAFDFMTKPIDANRLSVAMRNALEYGELRREVHTLNTRVKGGELKHPEAFSSIITSDARMLELFRHIEAVAGSGQTILITGESGTGKELLARSIHDAANPEAPFVAVNVAGLDDVMFSDTLFGHLPGAYTGAEGKREGLANRAAEGTLFLDEIGDLSLQSQTKLLRLIQEREYYQLGGDSARRFQARVVAATNADIEHLVEHGSFRKDLYYRLLTHRFHLPPLRERRGDIPLLIEAFAKPAFAQYDNAPGGLPPEVTNKLLGYSFPGNIRELRSTVFDLASRIVSGDSDDEIMADLSRRFGPESEPAEVTAGKIIEAFGRFPTLQEVDDLLIRAALATTDGNQSAAAKLVGLSQSTLSRKMKDESRDG